MSARTTQRRPSRRGVAIAGGVLAAVAVAIVLGIVLSGRASSQPNVPPVGALRDGLPAAAEVNALFKGIPQHGMTLGSPSAPVTMVEYIDFQCPYCREVEMQTLPDVLDRYVRTGKVKLVARPLAFVGSDSIRGRNAMVAAASQNRAFEFAELLYANQGTENTGWLNDDMVAHTAGSIPGLDVGRLLDERNSSPVLRTAASYDALAISDKVTGAPTFVLTSSGGSPVNLVAPPSATLAAALDEALRS